MEKLHLKTREEVLEDFKTFVTEGAIGRAITGKVYIEGERPVESEGEDAVLLWGAGEDTQLQKGQVICNIYVKDDDLCLAWDRNQSRKRIAELEKTVHAFIDEFTCEDYYQIRTQDTMTVEKEALRGQHYIHVRFHFARSAS